MAYRLSVFIGDTDLYRHRLYAKIVHRARKAGMAGASVFRGILGISVPNLPAARRWGISQNVPVVIVIVDVNINAFLPALEEVMDSELAILEHVWLAE